MTCFSFHPRKVITTGEGATQKPMPNFAPSSELADEAKSRREGTLARIDVVIPCYKCGCFLYQCTDSVLGQAGVEVRILIIDDASPDNTAEVAAALAREDSRVTVIRHTTNKGHINTYNEGWGSQGPQVAAFEREFAELVKTTHACAVSNCTITLHLALLSVGVSPGDEVITASHSFIATANAIRYCGATPIFVDIDPKTYNIDPQRVAEAVTGRTRAILAVHKIGMPCDLPALASVASRHRHRSDRGRCLRGWKRNPNRRTMGANWQTSRTNRLLFVPSVQSDYDRGGRHADDI
jgi:glycosyltransferase involved in cell wall biosynthesis